MGPVLDLQGVAFEIALLGLCWVLTYGLHGFGIFQVLAAFFGERHWYGHLDTVLDCIAGVYHFLHV
jgi:hypothetical protein